MSWMLNLDHMKDVDALRLAAKILDRENARLIEQNRVLQTRLMRLEGTDAETLQARLMELEQQLKNARQEAFGDSSEKREAPTTEAAQPAPKPKQKGHGPRPQPQLPVIETVHTLDPADRDNCAKCGDPMKEWKGGFEESEEIDVIERRVILRKHKRQKYVCGCGEAVETALGPQKLVPGGRFSTDFAIEVSIDKYADHIPLERQVRRFAREGLEVTSQSLFDQVHAVATACEPVAAAIHAHLLSKPLVHADESHWKLLDGDKEREQTRWQAWDLVAEDAASYTILPSRSAESAKKVLHGYAGIVMCDDYAAYDALKAQGVVLAHCWAHARRKFIECEGAAPQALLDEILGLIRRLYDIESTAPPGDTPDALALRAQRRQAESRPAVLAIRDWALAQRPLPRSTLARAIAYMTKNWVELTRFLDDARIPLDNNPAERALRGLVVGRKVHYGSKSERGIKVAATLYTVLETAKLNGLDPRAWLRAALKAHIDGAPPFIPVRALNPALP